VGEHGRREPHPLVHVEGNLMELVPDHLLLDRRNLKVVHQALDKVTVSLFRGDASGGGVRVGEQPFVLERGQFVADRGRANPELQARQSLGPDRLGSIHILPDHEPQNLALPLCDFHWK
jgi:hypothetical protein